MPPLVDSIFIDLGPVDDSLASRYPYQVGGFRWDYLFDKVLTLLHFMLSFTRARVPLGQIAIHRHAAQLDDMLLLLFVYSLAISPMQRGRPRKWPVSLWEQGKLAHATERFQCEARRAMRVWDAS